MAPISVLRCNWYELLTDTRISELALLMHSLIIRGLDGLGHVAGCCGALSLLAYIVRGLLDKVLF